MRNKTNHKNIRSPPVAKIETFEDPILVKLNAGGAGKLSIYTNPRIIEPPNRVKLMPIIEIAFKKLTRQVGYTAWYTPAIEMIWRLVIKWKAMAVDCKKKAESSASPRLT